jgi:BON domain
MRGPGGSDGRCLPHGGSGACYLQTPTRGSKLVPLSDLTIRDKVIKHLNSQQWVHTSLLNVTVNGGVIDLWGLAASEAERNAIRVAAENTPGVRAVPSERYSSKMTGRRELPANNENSLAVPAVWHRQGCGIKGKTSALT